MRNLQRSARSVRRGFLFALLALGIVQAFQPGSALAQVDDRPPQPPAHQSTTQLNPRGADIVEPMHVYRVTQRAGEQADTVYLGIAKIPDPRRGEHGAFVRHDVNSGARIRISDAMIFGDAALAQIVEFDPRATRDELMFRPGPHDVVTSRQGVEPVRSAPGEVVVFDLQALYEAAARNPITGAVAGDGSTAPRTALLRMESTYQRGEAVNLIVPMVPRPRPVVMPRIEVARYDTTILHTPEITYVLSTETVRAAPFTILATLETGYGPRFVRTEIPATTRAPFTTSGWADGYFVDGALAIEGATYRWRAHMYGSSSLVRSDQSDISHHQIALLADLRFEYGRPRFLVIEAAGRLADKPHQEFTWESADYAGSIRFGIGSRVEDWRGRERRQVEGLVGLRMGENRVIEVYQAGARARGIGPELLVNGSAAWPMRFGSQARLRGSAHGYVITGRGPRDRGFGEHSVRLQGEALLGRPIFGFFLFGALRASTHYERADYADDSEYYMWDAWLAPAAGVELRL